MLAGVAGAAALVALAGCSVAPAASSSAESQEPSRIADGDHVAVDTQLSPRAHESVASPSLVISGTAYFQYMAPERPYFAADGIPSTAFDIKVRASADGEHYCAYPELDSPAGVSLDGMWLPELEYVAEVDRFFTDVVLGALTCAESAEEAKAEGLEYLDAHGPYSANFIVHDLDAVEVTPRD